MICAQGRGGITGTSEGEDFFIPPNVLLLCERFCDSCFLMVGSSKKKKKLRKEDENEWKGKYARKKKASIGRLLYLPPTEHNARARVIGRVSEY